MFASVIYVKMLQTLEFGCGDILKSPNVPESTISVAHKLLANMPVFADLTANRVKQNKDTPCAYPCNINRGVQYQNGSS